MNNKYIINGQHKLSGSVKISGSKNSVLPIMASCILTDECVTLHDVPPLRDVVNMASILQHIGYDVQFDTVQEIMTIKKGDTINTNITLDCTRELRASFLLAGSVLAKYGTVTIPMPGGCNIGTRPIDLHLKGFSLLNCTTSQIHGNITVSTDNLQGNTIYLDFPSVGATENIIIASVLAQGTTILENCAVEPEIIDLCNFLTKLGAKIYNIGTDTLTIQGVKKLTGTTHTIIPDRIEAGTFMIAAAITKSQINIQNIIPEHLKPVIAKLNEVGVLISEQPNALDVDARGVQAFKSTDIKTLPYPGFPTDMQSQFASLLATANGTSIITETIFENRFMYTNEMLRMGSEVKVEGRTAVIDGVQNLTGAKVVATDLRAGAALVLLALASKGDTEISDIFHIERGYNNIEYKLKALGASINKV